MPRQKWKQFFCFFRLSIFIMPMARWKQLHGLCVVIKLKKWHFNTNNIFAFIFKSLKLIATRRKYEFWQICLRQLDDFSWNFVVLMLFVVVQNVNLVILNIDEIFSSFPKLWLKRNKKRVDEISSCSQLHYKYWVGVHKCKLQFQKWVKN